jgi:hypothetical protein
VRGSMPLALAVVLLACACSSSTPQVFTVTSASVDSAYICPSGSNNAPYDLHGSVDVFNPTASSVPIESVKAEMTLVGVKGSWLERLGDKYDAGLVKFRPDSARAGGDTTLAITIPSACTNGKITLASYGDYQVAFTLITSMGMYSVVAKNRHRIRLASSSRLSG